MAKSQRVSVLITDEAARAIEVIEARQVIRAPLSAICSVALEHGLVQIAASEARPNKARIVDEPGYVDGKPMRATEPRSKAVRGIVCAR